MDQEGFAYKSESTYQRSEDLDFGMIYHCSVKLQNQSCQECALVFIRPVFTYRDSLYLKCLHFLLEMVYFFTFSRLFTTVSQYIALSLKF